MYIYQQKGNKKQRCKRKKRAIEKQNRIKNRVSIHDRPNIENVFGHFEGDSIVSMMHSSGQAIHTEVEKKTKVLFAKKLNKKTSNNTLKAMIQIFQGLRDVAQYGYIR